MAHASPPRKTGLTDSGLTYVPSEIGSRLARAFFHILELEADRHRLEVGLQEHKRMIAELEAHLRQNQNLVQQIYSSHGWRLLDRYYRVRNWLLPVGSLRHSLVTGLAETPLRKLQRVLRKNREGLARPSHRPQLPDLEKNGPETTNPPAPPEAFPATASRYASWIRMNEPDRADLERQRQTRWAHEPRISLLVAVQSTSGRFLEALVQSFRAQTYVNGELCLVESAGPEVCLPALLAGLTCTDERIRVLPPPAEQGLAAAYEAARTAATGDYLAPVQPTDLLTPSALFEMARALQQHPEADLLYADEDCVNEAGDERAGPHFKPDWSPDTLRSHNYIGHLSLFSRVLLDRAGGFRPDSDGARNYDLILRASEKARQIVHIPRILYHRRTLAAPLPAHEPAEDVGRRALEEHLRRLGTVGEVHEGLRPGTYQVTYSLAARPLVSIIIPNKDHADMLARCVESIRRSGYSHYEIIIVENASVCPETFACYQELMRRPDVRLITWKKPFNYSAVNNLAVAQAAGEVLLFLNNDVQVINADWLERMLEHALRPQVGAVGAKLYYPDDTIQHAGIYVSKQAGGCHLHRFLSRAAAGPDNRLVTVQNLSCVTGACLMTRKAVFEEVGGFDEAFPLDYNDADFCQRLLQQGRLIVWTPYAELYHFESVSRGYYDTHEKRQRSHAQSEVWLSKWDARLPETDPYYNLNLALDWEEGLPKDEG